MQLSRWTARESLGDMSAMYIPLSHGLHWVLCEVRMPVLIRSDAEDPAGGYPTGKLTIFDSLFGDRSDYQDTVALLIEHLHYVWASREIALRRNGNEGEPN